MPKPKTIKRNKSGEIKEITNEITDINITSSSSDTSAGSDKEVKEKTPPTKEQVIKSLTAKIKRVEVQLQKYNIKLTELKANLDNVKAEPEKER